MTDSSIAENYRNLIWSIPDFRGAIDVLNAYNLRNMPETLYRFRSAKEDTRNPLRWRAIDEIVNKYIYLSPATDQNDPFDSSFTFDCDQVFARAKDWREILTISYESAGVEINSADVAALSNCSSYYEAIEYFVRAKCNLSHAEAGEFARLLNTVTQEFAHKRLLNDFAKGIQKSISLYSFTTCPTEQRMWGYYNNYEGICIGYNPRQTDASTSFLRLTLPVQYHEGGLDITRFYPEGFDVNRSTIGIALLAALIKDKKWEHENEWRYLAPGGIGPLRVTAPAITEVIIGHRARSNLIEAVVEVCRERRIPISRTQPDHASRTIIVEPYERRRGVMR